MRLQQLTTFAIGTGAVAAVLAAPTAPALADSEAHGSAYGVRAIGPVAVPAVPSVTSTDGRPVRESLVRLPGNSLIKASGLNAAARPGQGSASVADVKSERLGLTARSVTAKCVNGKGVSELADARLAGRPLALRAKPNSSVAVPVPGLGTAEVVLNKQTRDSRGRLNVTAIDATVPLGKGRTEKLSIASVRCAPPAAAAPRDQQGAPPTSAAQPGRPGAAGGHGSAVGHPGAGAQPNGPAHPGSAAQPRSVVKAPAPRPVTGDLPVTG
ncbi:hypothetical protein Acsp04_32120 [Actinomadura sp. NBRC 104425]|uniref:choice-of-anchor P family protein n=1 Tax=Actinomadura sp. NBRC 104425 TaxID=3032204 RepID=UPI0024A4E5FF|nr:choice-of-anchor P family protein [Actinomadura sp. NBRC 104425]GLZ12977.1 hypothetical protein Acsp04_32120 [Actinomadura sp. NBRC 104425]